MVTAYAYDPDGALIKASLPFAPATPPSERARYLYERNEAGELTGIAIPRGGEDPIVTAYSYDALGRITTETLCEGDDATTFSYDYNMASELTRQQDGRGVVITHHYDARGNKTSEEASEVGEDAGERTYSYDATGNLTTAANHIREVSISYDDSSRPLEVSSGPDSTTYSYDDFGRLEQLTTGAGTTTYAYDQDTGRLVGLIDPFTEAPTSLTYSDAGRLESRSDPTGAVHALSYDEAGRISSRTVTASSQQLARFTRTYDEASNVTTETREVAGSNEPSSRVFIYDDSSRLIEARIGTRSSPTPTTSRPPPSSPGLGRAGSCGDSLSSYY